MELITGKMLFCMDAGLKNTLESYAMMTEIFPGLEAAVPIDAFGFSLK